MNCLMFKAVTRVYGYMHIYKYEYKCLRSKETDVKIGLSYLQLLIMNINFFFHDMYFTLANMFQLLLMKSLFIWTHIYHIS